jgi:hypothetical protein
MTDGGKERVSIAEIEVRQGGRAGYIDLATRLLRTWDTLGTCGTRPTSLACVRYAPAIPVEDRWFRGSGTHPVFALQPGPDTLLSSQQPPLHRQPLPAPASAH